MRFVNGLKIYQRERTCRFFTTIPFPGLIPTRSLLSKAGTEGLPWQVLAQKMLWGVKVRLPPPLVGGFCTKGLGGIGGAREVTSTEASTLYIVIKEGNRAEGGVPWNRQWVKGLGVGDQ